MAAMLQFGVKRASMELIAKRAGVSHMTIYRRWPRKQDVIMAVLMREGQRLYTRVDTDLASVDSIEDKLVAGFTAIFGFFHTHPLLVRELDADPESVLSALTLGADPMIRLSTDYLAGHIRHMAAPALVEHADSIAELLVRVSHSLILSPPAAHRLETTSDISDYARRTLLPLIQHHTAATTHAESQT